MFRRLSLLAPCALVIASTGCIDLGRPDDAPEIHFYAIDPPTGQPRAETTGKRTLSQRPFSAPRRYEERIVRRVEGGRIEFLEFHRWAESPGQGLERAVISGLSRTGEFEAVVDASIDVDAELVLDVHIVHCDVVGELGSPGAKLSLWFLLSDRSNAELLYDDVFTATLPVPGPDLDGVGAAMAECAVDVARQAVAAWKAAGLFD